jgi:hypothetical protein
MDGIMRNTRRTEMEMKKSINALTKDVEDNKEEIELAIREENVAMTNKARNLQEQIAKL